MSQPVNHGPSLADRLADIHAGLYDRRAASAPANRSESAQRLAAAIDHSASVRQHLDEESSARPLINRAQRSQPVMGATSAYANPSEAPAQPSNAAPARSRVRVVAPNEQHIAHASSAAPVSAAQREINVYAERKMEMLNYVLSSMHQIVTPEMGARFEEIVQLQNELAKLERTSDGSNEGRIQDLKKALEKKKVENYNLLIQTPGFQERVAGLKHLLADVKQAFTAGYAYPQVLALRKDLTKLADQLRNDPKLQSSKQVWADRAAELEHMLIHNYSRLSPQQRAHMEEEIYTIKTKLEQGIEPNANRTIAQERLEALVAQFKRWIDPQDLGIEPKKEMAHWNHFQEAIRCVEGALKHFANPVEVLPPVMQAPVAPVAPVLPAAGSVTLSMEKKIHEAGKGYDYFEKGIEALRLVPVLGQYLAVIGDVLLALVKSLDALVSSAYHKIAGKSTKDKLEKADHNAYASIVGWNKVKSALMNILHAVIGLIPGVGSVANYFLAKNLSHPVSQEAQEAAKEDGRKLFSVRNDARLPHFNIDAKLPRVASKFFWEVQKGKGQLHERLAIEREMASLKPTTEEKELYVAIEDAKKQIQYGSDKAAIAAARKDLKDLNAKLSKIQDGKKHLAEMDRLVKAKEAAVKAHEQTTAGLSDIISTMKDVQLTADQDEFLLVDAPKIAAKEAKIKELINSRNFNADNAARFEGQLKAIYQFLQRYDNQHDMQYPEVYNEVMFAKNNIGRLQSAIAHHNSWKNHFAAELNELQK